jgi:hypothetical protein
MLLFHLSVRWIQRTEVGLHLIRQLRGHELGLILDQFTKFVA